MYVLCKRTVRKTRLGPNLVLPHPVSLGPESPHGVCRCLLDIFLQSRKNLCLPDCKTTFWTVVTAAVANCSHGCRDLSRNIFFENVPNFNPLSRLDEPSASVPRCVASILSPFVAKRQVVGLLYPNPVYHGRHFEGIIFCFLIEPSRGKELQFFA